MHCHVSKVQLQQPWHQLVTKPSRRTRQSLSSCLQAVKKGVDQTKGVCSEPILNFDVEDVVDAFLHLFAGVWNKMLCVGKEKLIALLDVPYTKQMPEARIMSARIAELDAKQTLHLQDIETNERTLSQLQADLKPLRSYLVKIQDRRGNKRTKTAAF